MLPREKGGVVNNKLKVSPLWMYYTSECNDLTGPVVQVHGTENLHVIDMSIIPLHFACHPQCVLYGIAEMGEYASHTEESRGVDHHCRNSC